MTRTRCAAPTKAGHPCRRWPEEGEDRCPVHQDVPVVEDPTGATEELRERQENPIDEDDNRCGARTSDGGICRNFPMGGTDRCRHHVGLEPTEAEKRSWKEGELKHGYFVAGFLNEEEREHFRRVVEEGADYGKLKRQMIAALVVRTDRMLRWEAESGEPSRFTSKSFAELRRLLDSLEPEELEVEHSWSIGEVQAHVDAILREDDELLCRVVPNEVEDVVREAL